MDENKASVINCISLLSNNLDNKAVANRLEESCKKVLRYKYRLGLNNYCPQPDYYVEADINRAMYYNFKQRLYDEAVRRGGHFVEK